MNKQQLISKLNNFWYYHKWHLLAVVFLIGVAAVGIHSCQSRKNPDLHVLFAKYENQIPLQSKELEQILQSFVEDENGDGEATAQVTATTVVNPDRSDTQAMLAQVNFGDAVLYVLSRETYTIMHDNGVLQDLSALGESPYLEGDRYCLSDCGILDDTQYFKNDQADYYLVLRKVDGTALEDSEKHQEQLRIAKEVVKKIMESEK